MANFLGELNDLGVLGGGLESVSDEQLAGAANFAAVAAGIVCERQGCEPPTKAEVIARLG